MRARRLVLGAALMLTCLAVPAGAQAYPDSPRDAIVSIGDSYISGEAGRWQGNSINLSGDRDGTDRAATCSTPATCTYDAGTVYVNGTDANGCHRSDVAEILTAAIPADLKVNLACSGAETANALHTTNGGQAFKGEAPQANQLAFIAAARRVKLIAVSIGGNDLGFASLVQACLTAYLTFAPPCKTTQEGPFLQGFVPVLGGIDTVLRTVRGVMRATGYAAGSYRLVLQSYPSVLPRASENRYAERDPVRSAGGGCPVYDSDSDWARDEVVPRIARGLRAVALANGAQFLDLRDAFQGREFCSDSASLVGVGGSSPPDASVHEWGRFMNQASLTEGEIQELFHPNAFGQQALARCLTLLWGQTGPEYRCTNTPGQGPAGMQLAAP